MQHGRRQCRPYLFRWTAAKCPGRLRVGFRDAEGAGGAFGVSVALFPVLEGAVTDAHEGGKLILAESAYLICTDPDLSLENLLQDYILRWDLFLPFRPVNQSGKHSN
jgi:hypothetical protein